MRLGSGLSISKYSILNDLDLDQGQNNQISQYLGLFQTQFAASGLCLPNWGKTNSACGCCC